MATLGQLARFGRKQKRRRNAVAALLGAPQRRGAIIKMGIMSPRKPNSAKRKFAKVGIIINKKVIFAHVPGIGPNTLQEYHKVLVEGGNPPDLPGVNYTLVRSVYDFDSRETFGRKNRRSKFGVKQAVDQIKWVRDRIKNMPKMTIEEIQAEKKRLIFEYEQKKKSR